MWRIEYRPDHNAALPLEENQWNAIAFGNGVFVCVSSAIGTGRRVMRSTDNGLHLRTPVCPMIDYLYECRWRKRGMDVAGDVQGHGTSRCTGPWDRGFVNVKPTPQPNSPRVPDELNGQHGRLGRHGRAPKFVERGQELRCLLRSTCRTDRLFDEEVRFVGCLRPRGDSEFFISSL